MTNTEDTETHLPDNPIIRRLLESLKDMPRYLEERRKKIEARREFVRFVFEDACIKAGLVEPLDENDPKPRRPFVMLD